MFTVRTCLCSRSTRTKITIGLAYAEVAAVIIVVVVVVVSGVADRWRRYERFRLA